MKGLLLLSGGIDSPVAGHVMRRQGCTIEAIHFSYEPFTDSLPEKKACAIARMMGWRIFVCYMGEGFSEIAKRCTHRYYFVLAKRLMLSVAESFSRRRGCDFLLTGENLGQVSSQTLENLCVIDAAVCKPVLRPLIGYDKLEIVNLAIEIKTYEISKGPEVCDVLGPRHPSTAARLDIILEEEKKVDLSGIKRKALENIREISL